MALYISFFFFFASIFLCYLYYSFSDGLISNLFSYSGSSYGGPPSYSSNKSGDASNLGTLFPYTALLTKLVSLLISSLSVRALVMISSFSTVMSIFYSSSCFPYRVDRHSTIISYISIGSPPSSSDVVRPMFSFSKSNNSISFLYFPIILSLFITLAAYYFLGCFILYSGTGFGFFLRFLFSIEFEFELETSELRPELLVGRLTFYYEKFDYYG